MSEQSTNELPQDAATATATVQQDAITVQSEAINLLELMEICSDLCLTQPFCLLQILEECAVSPEITPPPLFAEIMSLKVSEVWADDWSKYIDCPKQ